MPPSLKFGAANDKLPAKLLPSVIPTTIRATCDPNGAVLGILMAEGTNDIIGYGGSRIVLLI